MIGLRFEIPNKYDMYLTKILSNLATDNYYWLINNEEILTYTGNLFSKNIYTDDEFKSIISSQEYYLIFAEIKLSKSKKMVEFNNYMDFKNSDCEIVILVVDSSMVDIYVKNIEVLKILKKNVETYGFDKISYIYDGDKRNIFSLNFQQMKE